MMGKTVSRWTDKEVERLTALEVGIAYRPYAGVNIAIAGFDTVEEAQAILPRYQEKYGYAAIITRNWVFEA